MSKDKKIFKHSITFDFHFSKKLDQSEFSFIQHELVHTIARCLTFLETKSIEVKSKGKKVNLKIVKDGDKDAT